MTPSYPTCHRDSSSASDASGTRAKTSCLAVRAVASQRLTFAVAAMAPRRVIADSDDDEDDADLSPAKTVTNAAPVDPPFVMEPMSPHHQPTEDTAARQPSPCTAPVEENAHTSDSHSTDPSFFAQVYDEQQVGALLHAQLVENIVRKSQRASQSSGEVSLPAKGRGIATNASSATDVTSPVMSREPRGRGRLLQMSDVTEVTTPRKSAGKDEWDVPSSDDEAPVVQSGKSLKMMKLSVSAADGPTSQDTGNLYVAQSNLTTSQKLEYRKVQVPDEPSGDMTTQDSVGQKQPPPNQKSSCATTIAYSTPSRYASSGPRPPWETAAPAELSVESKSRGGVVDVSTPGIRNSWLGLTFGSVAHVFARRDNFCRGEGGGLGFKK
jgi:hypothetical protein